MILSALVDKMVFGQRLESIWEVFSNIGFCDYPVLQRCNSLNNFSRELSRYLTRLHSAKVTGVSVFLVGILCTARLFPQGYKLGW